MVIFGVKFVICILNFWSDVERGGGGEGEGVGDGEMEEEEECLLRDM